MALKRQKNGRHRGIVGGVVNARVFPALFAGLADQSTAPESHTVIYFSYA